MKSERLLVDGPVGPIETVFDFPDTLDGAPARGLALVAHPHPLYGGTLDNKVAQTLAKTFVELGYVSVRPNFRGVGASAGAHDEGHGETDDLIAVLQYAQRKLAMADGTSGADGAIAPIGAIGAGATAGRAAAPVVLAGFSFGSLVLSRVATRLATQGNAAQRLIFVGTAVTRGRVDDVPADTVVIHGELDDTVPLEAVLRWAEPLELPVVVIPGADHFFHRRLHLIKGIIVRAWCA